MECSSDEISSAPDTGNAEQEACLSPNVGSESDANVPSVRTAKFISVHTSSEADPPGRLCDVSSTSSTSASPLVNLPMSAAQLPLATCTTLLAPGGLPIASRRIFIKSATGEQYAISLPTVMVPGQLGGAYLIASSQSHDNSGDHGDQFTMDASMEQAATDAQVVEVASRSDPLDVPVDTTACCLVCGDKGSGFHYSAYSCEGCKGFFKRTVQKNMSYMCKDNGTCQINKITRNSCQHCRFRRCLDVGMKKEAVREDRTPGGKHRSKRFRPDYGDVIGGMSTSDMVDWNITSEEELLITQLVDARPDVIPEQEEASRMFLNSKEVDFNEFIPLTYIELRCIIEWAKKVPGFTALLLEDQMALLKSSFMELIVLRLAFRSLDCSGAVRFTSSLLLSPSQCDRLGWCEDLISCTLEFLARLRNIDIDHSEFCILNAILLTYPDASGLSDRSSVVSLQNLLLDLLHKYSLFRYPENPRRSGRILLRLPSLRTISAKAAEKFLSCSLEGDVKMNSLVSEMIS